MLRNEKRSATIDVPPNTALLRNAIDLPLKALAEYLDLSLGDLLEGMVLHAFENKPPFSPTTLQRIAQLKDVYGMEYDAQVSHRLIEDVQPPETT